jgi:tetratricopeptide (TPR) repeat protein
MTHFSKLALAAALVAGTSGLALTPALAKKDDKAAQGGGLKLSPDVIKPAQTAQTALGANDTATAEPAVAAVEAAAKTDDDKYIAAVFRLQLEAAKEKAVQTTGGKVDERPLRAPLEALVASPKTEPAKKGTFAFQRARLSFDAGEYADAVKWFNQAKQLGYNDPQMDLALVKAKLESGDTQGGLADLNAAIDRTTASGQKAPEDYYKYAVSTSVKKGTKADTMAWMKRWLSAYPTPDNYRSVLFIYGVDQSPLTKLDRPQLVDVYRLLRQTKSLDQYAYEDYGQKVLDMGLPDEAKTVITEGRANGKVPTNGNGPAILTDANKAITAEGSLASLETKAKSAATGSLAQQTADAYLGKGDYAKAIPLYQLALQKGSVKTDDVNTHLGIAMALSGDKAGAKTAFAAVQGPARAEIAQFWTFWLDHPVTA